jgi:hypothetical protein
MMKALKLVFVLCAKGLHKAEPDRRGSFGDGTRHRHGILKDAYC